MKTFIFNGITYKVEQFGNTIDLIDTEGTHIAEAIIDSACESISIDILANVEFCEASSSLYFETVDMTEDARLLKIGQHLAAIAQY